MKYDYYLHRSGGKVFDYFGGIGTPYRVGIIRFYIAKVLKYKATRVRKGTGIKGVYIRAALNQGIHRNSYYMNKIKRGVYDEV